jgi:hypothetical protein
MITYRKDEILNKHGVYIAYWSKQKGNTELEKFKNFQSGDTEYIIKDKNGNDIICMVNPTEGPEGHILVAFNHLGETIINTDDCQANDEWCVKQCLKDYKLI